LADSFDRAVASLGAALNPETIRHYRWTVRSFLTYLGVTHPEVKSLSNSPRSSHARVDGSSTLPVPDLSGTFHELVWMNGLPELAHLIPREDIPASPTIFPHEAIHA
jgi:hypothetical protein